jgi:predicted ATP-dependent endonuclease of OLD family
MRIVTFSVKNYRSIIKAHRLPLSDMTVLVGPNNEGKSNILHALATALRIVTEARPYRVRRSYRYDLRSGDIDFVWQRDFPVHLQEEKPNGASDFRLEFKLSDTEREEFRSVVGSSLTGNLNLHLMLRPDSADFEVPIQGLAKRVLSKKRSEIATFVKSNLEFQYISSVRTSDMTVRTVKRMLDRALSSLEQNPEYQDLLTRIQELQRPVLQNLEESLRSSFVEFVPGVRAVELSTEEKRISHALRRSCRVLIDDGTKTDLELKGDGIKSLTAIALMRHSSQTQSGGKSLILAIEEPESHLHPQSVHRLRIVLDEISRGHQVVITTHSPLLVDRQHVQRNIIVISSRASPAESLTEIRQVLGVKVADNLISADIVLLVEGESDRKILQTWLSEISNILKSAFDQRTLAIDLLHGASHLAYKADLYKTLLCNVHAYVDGDEDGRRAVDKAIQRGALDTSEYNLSACPGMKEAEIEDLVSMDTYQRALEEQYAIELNVKHFRTSNRKWSGRLKDTFERQGKLWTEEIEKQAKGIVADLVVQHGISSLVDERRGSIDALAKSLEKTLGH